MIQHLPRIAVAALSLFALAHRAAAVPFTLNASTATTVDGNTTSSFYEVASNGTDSGTGAALYTAAITGTGAVSANNPPKVEIFFGSNPQPILTSAFVKAGNGYLWWDAADLAAFNGGTWTSLILVQNGLLNPPGSAYLDISHAGINGTPGSDIPGGRVPDAGSTALLAGIALAGLLALRRRLG